jgi:hypothetical protein
MLTNFVRWLRDVRADVNAMYPGEDVPMYFVGHRFLEFDGPLLRLGLARINVDFSELCSELDITSVIDTLHISRNYVNWDAWHSEQAACATVTAAGDICTVTVLPTQRADDSQTNSSAATTTATNVPAVQANEGDSTNHPETPSPFCMRRRFTDTKSVFSTMTSTPVWSTAQFRAASKKPPASRATVEELQPPGMRQWSHKLDEVHLRLTGTHIGGAHEAENDVQALVDIITTATMVNAIWKSTDPIPAATSVQWMCENAAHLERLYLNTVRGWRLDLRPTCEHGPMRVKTVCKDSSVEGGWAVYFACRKGLYAPRQCVETFQGTHDSFEYYKPVAVPGIPGACTCTGKCATKRCVCRAAGVMCTDACAKHQSVKCACGNRPIVVEDDSASDETTPNPVPEHAIV